MPAKLQLAPLQTRPSYLPTDGKDVLARFVHTTLAWLREHADSALRTLGERLHAYVRHRRFQVHTHPFWVVFQMS